MRLAHAADSPGQPHPPAPPNIPRGGGMSKGRIKSWVRALCCAKGSNPTSNPTSKKGSHRLPFLLLLLPLIPPFPSAPAGNCREAWAGRCRTVGAMGPRHASGGLGRTPNPGLAVCAGQRTRARRHRAPMDGFTACPAKAHPYRPPRINQGAANGALDKPYSANIAVSFSRAGPASFGLSSAKRIVASTSPRCVPQSKRVPSKR